MACMKQQPDQRVRWSCFVKTRRCPIDNYDEDETIQHLILKSRRFKNVCWKMSDAGFNIGVNYNAVMGGVFLENVHALHPEFYGTIICTFEVKLAWHVYKQHY